MPMDFDVVFHLPDGNAAKLDELNALFEETSVQAPLAGAPDDPDDVVGDGPFTAPLFQGEYYNLHKHWGGDPWNGVYWWQGEFLDELRAIAWPRPETVQFFSIPHDPEWTLVNLDGTTPADPLAGRGPGAGGGITTDGGSTGLTHLLLAAINKPAPPLVARYFDRGDPQLAHRRPRENSSGLYYGAYADFSPDDFLDYARREPYLASPYTRLFVQGPGDARFRFVGDGEILG